MIIFIVVILSIALIAGMLIYVRQLNKLVLYSKEHGLELFGRNYSSLSALVSDISFLNNLFSGKGIAAHHDNQLVAQLRKVRVLLWSLIIVGIVDQVLVVINAGLT